MLLKFQLMRHFDKSVCCRENTEGFLDSHFDGDNFEQKSVATEMMILLYSLDLRFLCDHTCNNTLALRRNVIDNVRVSNAFSS